MKFVNPYDKDMADQESLQEFNDTQEKKRRQRRAIQFIGVETGIVAVVAVVFLLILNYYNIISIPGLGGLQNKTVSVENGEPVDQETEVYQFACPLGLTHCKQGKILYDVASDRLAGIAYRKLPENTPIVAAISGEYTYSEYKNESDGLPLVTFTVRDEKPDELHFEAVYTWQGSVSPQLSGKKSGRIEQGTQLGLAGGSETEIVAFTSQPYSLYIEVRSSQSGFTLPLEPSEDGLGLVPR